jgi:hypothetical protein
MPDKENAEPVPAPRTPEELVEEGRLKRERAERVRQKIRELTARLNANLRRARRD